jgi:hypothetical protein
MSTKKPLYLLSALLSIPGTDESSSMEAYLIADTVLKCLAKVASSQMGGYADNEAR